MTEPPKDDGLAFRDRVKQLRCPHCSEAFTDSAVDWGDEWVTNDSPYARDGPFKVQCEACLLHAFVNYFDWTVSTTDPHCE